ncbi:MAG: alanine racemase, partial [Bdellovibrionales bacterium]|nr:alanine racemase [Bdellovibrionales bacterium]
HLLRPTVAEIDLDALVANFRTIQAAVGPARVLPILKANAYGHGLVPCARALEKEGASFFGVALLEEGIALRQAGIRVPIMALGGIAGRQIDGFLTHGIDITASSVMKLQQVEATARKLGVRARVHLKIDTGMERIGVHYYTAESLLAEAVACQHIEIVSVFSHFATAEQEDLGFAKIQLERFLECTAFFERRSLPMPLRHMANSGAVLQFQEAHLDLVRPGLALFGVSPAPHLAGRLSLQPVLSLRSEIVFFKVVRAGASVSYDRTWTAPEDTRIVTVPIGYGDGFSRRLSNRGSVLLRGKRYPLVGKICMDQLMVDIGPDGVGYNGDEVVLIGTQGGERISIEELTELVETDPRDILTSLNVRLPRRFHQGGREFLQDEASA